jgi:transmembrane sensor
MTTTPHIPADQALRDRAVEWHVRLASDAATEADWLAFEAWLAEGPAHGQAYDAVEAVWSELAGAPALAPAVAPFRSRRRVRIEAWIGAIAACLVVAVALGVGLRASGPPAQAFQTARGERQVVILADGSRVTLNGDSRITVRMADHERRISMAEAEAAFDVVKDPKRPFLIEAGDRQIRVVGTEFNVLRRAGEVRVAVRRGVVEVRPAGAPSGPLLARLHAGEGLVHREGKGGDSVAAADIEAAFAWTEGRLIFRNEPLAKVVTVLNRYVETPIVVAPDAAGIRVTAALELETEDAMLRRLAAFLPIRVERGSQAVRLSLRQGSR